MFEVYARSLEYESVERVPPPPKKNPRFLSIHEGGFEENWRFLTIHEGGFEENWLTELELGFYAMCT